MVSWSVETLFLALVVIGVLCALYVAVKAFQQSPRWGALFVLSPAAFYFLSLYAGWLIAGVVVMAAQFYYVKQPYNWKTWGRIYVYMVICWAGATSITARDGRLLPFMAAQAPSVEQAGAAVSTASESFLPVDGGRIWYRTSGSGSGIPVILVHGGPGAGSFSLKPLEALGEERLVVRYDQLGAGKSDRMTDGASMTVERFVGELDSLRATLGHERVHLLGHSWGAAVALEYALANRERVASLILSGPLVSAPVWIRNTRRLVATLPAEAQQAIASSEESGDYDSPDYQAAMREFADRYVSRRPIEVDLDSARRTFGVSSYHRMWGPSEFTVTGTLKRYDATRRLRGVSVPTLFTVGEHDEADTASVRAFSQRVPGARLAIIPDAAHTTMWDNPDELLRVVREFLRTVEAPVPEAAASAASPAP